MEGAERQASQTLYGSPYSGFIALLWSYHMGQKLGQALLHLAVIAACGPSSLLVLSPLPWFHHMRPEPVQLLGIQRSWVSQALLQPPGLKPPSSLSDEPFLLSVNIATAVASAIVVWPGFIVQTRVYSSDLDDV